MCVCVESPAPASLQNHSLGRVAARCRDFSSFTLDTTYTSSPPPPHTHQSYTVTVSHLEIYNEELADLLEEEQLIMEVSASASVCWEA